MDDGNGYALVTVDTPDPSDPSAPGLRGFLTLEGIAFDPAMTSITDYVSEDAISIV